MFIFFIHQSVYSNVSRVLEVAEKLSEAGHYESDKIEEIAEAVGKEWKSFDMDINQRSSLLSCSFAYHKHSEEVSCLLFSSKMLLSVWFIGENSSFAGSIVKTEVIALAAIELTLVFHICHLSSWIYISFVPIYKMAKQRKLTTVISSGSRECQNLFSVYWNLWGWR
mgnify:CR=1 FL=1